MKGRIVIAAGGTGGHILPGIEIGQALSDWDVTYIAGRRDIEKRIYASRQIEAITLRCSKNPKRFAKPIKAMLACMDIVDVAIQFLQSRPSAVLAMGGAVCFPVLAVCRLLKIPYFLHESNATPGQTIRWFSTQAKAIFTGFPLHEFSNAICTGTPAAKPSSGLDGDRDIILCVGGSQGAERLNHLFIQAASTLQDLPYQFVLVTGPGKAPNEHGPVQVIEYVEDMPELMVRSLMAVSRAGAGSLSDLANCETPALLIPYPHAADDHQVKNAQHFVAAGAADMITEDQLTARILASSIRKIITTTGQIDRMKEALRHLAKPEAAQLIVDQIEAFVTWKTREVTNQPAGEKIS